MYVSDFQFIYITTHTYAYHGHEKSEGQGTWNLTMGRVLFDVVMLEKVRRILYTVPAQKCIARSWFNGFDQHC